MYIHNKIKPGNCVNVHPVLFMYIDERKNKYDAIIYIYILLYICNMYFLPVLVLP